MLKDFLTAERIRLNVEAKDWEDAIRQASAPLIALKKITPDYVNSMLQAVRDFGPYIVIAPGIAFAHARPGSGVTETCLSMITLQRPVYFGSVRNDPVGIVFAFGAKNGNDHLAVLQDLARMLSSEENIELIRNETDKGRIVERILEA